MDHLVGNKSPNSHIAMVTGATGQDGYLLTERLLDEVMYESLGEGGRLILTVPVDREFRVEYRDTDYYGTQVDWGDGKYFFQYVYDKHSLWERLIKPLGRDPTVVRWFGERERGRYGEYERRWIEQGRDCTVEDPREMAEHYREFATWEEMPGTGVCGLMIQKEESTTRSE
jgi:hypothetical protein